MFIKERNYINYRINNKKDNNKKNLTLTTIFRHSLIGHYLFMS